MLEFDVDPYCNDCGIFEPVVASRDYYTDSLKHKRVKNVITCKFKNDCKSVAKCLKTSEKSSKK